MKTIDVSPEQWPRFCEDFSRQHRGWLVTTSLLERASRVPTAELNAAEAHRTARDLPFAGLDLELNRRDLMMRLGDGNRHVHEPIHGVTRICRLETDAGADAGLRIDKANDTGVLLTFSVAARPDALDGIAASEL